MTSEGASRGPQKNFLGSLSLGHFSGPLINCAIIRPLHRWVCNDEYITAQKVCFGFSLGATENAGVENVIRAKMQGWKMQEWKMQE